MSKERGRFSGMISRTRLTMISLGQLKSVPGARCELGRNATFKSRTLDAGGLDIKGEEVLEGLLDAGGGLWGDRGWLVAQGVLGTVDVVWGIGDIEEVCDKALHGRGLVKGGEMGL